MYEIATVHVRKSVIVNMGRIEIDLKTMDAILEFPLALIIDQYHVDAIIHFGVLQCMPVQYLP